MQVKFCGAARFVTGSSHLITLDSGYKILLDCGLFQGKGKHIWDWNNTWHFDPRNVDCVILSHAHIDHTGRIPQLVKEGFNGSIHCTHATRSLSAIMLLDSAKIQERDVEWYNKKLLKKRKKSKDLRVPLYKSEDVTPALELYVSYGYDRWYRISEEVEMMFTDAGHLLGSATVTLRITEGEKVTLVGFTGDIGRPNRPILRDPHRMPDVDYLICESTYGDKNHESNPEQNDKLLDVIHKTCVENKGKLIIPAFSVGRTQEIVYMLDKLETAGKLPKIPVFVDSPLSVNATQVYGSHPECFDDKLNEYLLIDSNPFGFNDLNYIRNVEQSKGLNLSSDPMIIISSSGMMNAGRVRHHLFNNMEKENTTILIVGYCSPDTAGGMLREGIESLKIFGEEKLVNANVEIMDSFSAHADRDEIIEFIGNHKGKLKKMFLVHGDYDTQQEFQKYLGEKGYNNVEIPEVGEEFEID